MESLCAIVKKDVDGKLKLVDYQLYPSTEAIRRAAAYALLYAPGMYGTVPVDNSNIQWEQSPEVSP